jgi:hypothetical protein
MCMNEAGMAELAYAADLKSADLFSPVAQLVERAAVNR